MVVIKERKIIKVGDSVAVTVPKEWHLAGKESVILLANNIGVIVPKGMKAKKIKEDFEEILQNVKEIIE